MSVLQRKELEASPLADLHAIASELGVEGFRAMRKAALVGAILGAQGVESPDAGRESPEEAEPEPGPAAAEPEPEADAEPVEEEPEVVERPVTEEETAAGV